MKYFLLSPANSKTSRAAEATSLLLLLWTHCSCFSPTKIVFVQASPQLPDPRGIYMGMANHFAIMHFNIYIFSHDSHSDTEARWRASATSSQSPYTVQLGFTSRWPDPLYSLKPFHD